MKAIGYLRVSTEEQATTGVSLAAQEERIRAYCAAAGLELAAIIREEGVSGSRPLALRPAGGDLVRALAKGEASQVVALKLDRLFRDAADALEQTRAWDRKGIALHLIDLGGQTINTASPMGRMFLTMMAGFAELERNLTAERTAAALAHLKAHGEAYSPTPYGFDREGSRLVESAQEQVTIARMHAQRAAGDSLRAIARLLNTEGTTAKRGGRWYASTVGKVLAHTQTAQGVAA